MALQFARSRAVYLSNQRCLSVTEERFDPIVGIHKRLGKHRKRRFAHEDQKNDPMLNDRCQFIRFVPDSLIMGQRDPSPESNRFQPHWVWAIRWEVISVTLYRKTRFLQDSRKGESEIAIGEERETHAARSKTIASSTASGLIS